MFESLQIAPPDAILGLIEAFQKDPNPAKINLTVGVYQDAHGQTPMLQCVKEAERRLLASESSKNYLGIGGLAAFNHQAEQLLFGADHPLLKARRVATIQTPGGTAALRVAADFLLRNYGPLTVWCSKPTWVNHPNVFGSTGHHIKTYSYLDAFGTGLDLSGMLSSLEQSQPGDVVCLHACCHNPTGVDPTVEQWQAIGDLIQEKRLLPLVDFAYHGFGDGLCEDAVGLGALLPKLEEIIVCSSYSKNFGLYGERVGALMVVTKTASHADAALSQMKAAVRANYSNPPRHGAAIVATILGDNQLRKQWEQELAEMRNRIHEMRHLFVESMRQRMPERDFSFIARQRGMFSYSGLTPLQVDQLRNQYAIYIVGSGRINVAGMNADTMPQLCDAIAAVCD
jgi:aspartate/tyrosine/aromatic aminotransferase